MLDKILENYPDEDILKIDGFDSAVIGIDPTSMRLIYSEDRIIEILITEEDMDEIEAIEHYEFNILGSYVGESTPIFCRTTY